MDINEIKKALYTENPTAEFSFYRKGTLYYNAIIDHPEETEIQFAVPANDTGDADFHKYMPAKHLIKYITQY